MLLRCYDGALVFTLHCIHGDSVCVCVERNEVHRLFLAERAAKPQSLHFCAMAVNQGSTVDPKAKSQKAQRIALFLGAPQFARLKRL